MGLLIPDSSLPGSWCCPDRPRANYLPLFVKNLQDIKEQPNQTTLEAMAELEQGRGVRFNSVKDLIWDLGI